MTLLQDWVDTSGEIEIEFYLPCFKDGCNKPAEVKVHWDSCSCNPEGHIYLYCRVHFDRHMFDSRLNRLYSVPMGKCRSCGDHIQALSWRGIGD